jgi:hypothetical protein
VNTTTGFERVSANRRTRTLVFYLCFSKNQFTPVEKAQGELGTQGSCSGLANERGSRSLSHSTITTRALRQRLSGPYRLLYQVIACVIGQVEISARTSYRCKSLRHICSGNDKLRDFSPVRHCRRASLGFPTATSLRLGTCRWRKRPKPGEWAASTSYHPAISCAALTRLEQT